MTVDMLPITIDNEKLKQTSNSLPDIEEVAAYCINTVIDVSAIKSVDYQELTEEELMSLPEKIGVFSFLEDEKEDIYSESDGSPIK